MEVLNLCGVYTCDGTPFLDSGLSPLPLILTAGVSENRVVRSDSFRDTGRVASLLYASCAILYTVRNTCGGGTA